MIHIQAIDHLVLRVIDLDAMLRLYCGALGCSIERRDDDVGLVQLRAGSSLIDLVPVSARLGQAGGAAPASEGRNLDHFCLRAEPRRRARRRVCRSTLQRIRARSARRERRSQCVDRLLQLDLGEFSTLPLR